MRAVNLYECEISSRYLDTFGRELFSVMKKKTSEFNYVYSLNLYVKTYLVLTNCIHEIEI